LILPVQFDFESGTSFPLEILSAGEHDEDTMNEDTPRISASFIVYDGKGRTWILTATVPMDKNMALDAALVNAAVQAFQSAKKTSEGKHD